MIENDPSIANEMRRLRIDDLQAIGIQPKKGVKPPKDPELRRDFRRTFEEVVVHTKMGGFYRSKKVYIQKSALSSLVRRVLGDVVVGKPNTVSEKSMSSGQERVLLVLSAVERACAQVVSSGFLGMMDCEEASLEDDDFHDHIRLVLPTIQSDGNQVSKPYFVRRDCLAYFLGVGPETLDVLVLRGSMNSEIAAAFRARLDYALPESFLSLVATKDHLLPTDMPSGHTKVLVRSGMSFAIKYVLKDDLRSFIGRDFHSKYGVVPTRILDIASRVTQGRIRRALPRHLLSFFPLKTELMPGEDPRHYLKIDIQDRPVAGSPRVISTYINTKRMAAFIRESLGRAGGLTTESAHPILDRALQKRYDNALPLGILNFIPGQEYDPLHPEMLHTDEIVLDVRSTRSGKDRLVQMRFKGEDLSSLVSTDIRDLTPRALSELVKGALTTREMAIPEHHLGESHPFDVATSSSSAGIVSIDILRTAEDGTTLYEKLHADRRALAEYLKLPVEVVKAVVDHLGANELVMRGLLVQDSYAEEYGEGFDLDSQQARAVALIADIIWDSPDISDEEIEHYSEVMEMPIEYDRESEILTFGKGVTLGEGGYGSVTKERFEALGASGGVTGRGRTAGTAARKIPLATRSADMTHEAEMAERLRDVPFVGGFLLSRKGAILSRVGDGGELKPKNPVVRALTLSSKGRIIGQALRGISGIHNRGIVHNDIKDHNIVLHKVGKTYQPIIIDFGAAREVNTAVGGSTMAYRPLELLSGQTRNSLPSNDAFAMGIVAFKVLTGASPAWFRTKDKGEMIKLMDTTLKHMRFILDRECKHMPREFRMAIEVLLDIDPEKRDINRAIQLIDEGVRILEQEEVGGLTRG